MFGLRTQELVLILLVLLLLFGGAKLPQLGASIGQAIRNFKKGFNEDPAAGGDKKSGSLASSTKTDAAEPSDTRAKQG
jgi:sec-independent protein translocase protein TatA